jgi:DNA-binding PadR family transcriptional regulator
MKDSSLSSASYVVLGLLATHGPMTPYDLKKCVDGSIGYFWDFPRAQLYVEPERLAALRFLTEEREPEGRRRRTYHLTESGRAALLAWLREDATANVQMRDPGLLKLAFAQFLSHDELIAMARQQRDIHTQRLAVYETILPQIEHRAEEAFSFATLRMGLLYERAAITYWEDIIARPPQLTAEKKSGD